MYFGWPYWNLNVTERGKLELICNSKGNSGTNQYLLRVIVISKVMRGGVGGGGSKNLAVAVRGNLELICNC